MPVKVYNPEVVGSNPAPATKLEPPVRESELGVSCFLVHMLKSSAPIVRRIGVKGQKGDADVLLDTFNLTLPQPCDNARYSYH
ncbi:hypothetical protein FRC0360_00695 [Corynebacterium diphtheriae]|nr:hypothetical protein FRC0360_00695 [Corynebacterium diphtheriae]